ncbi:putative outer membrane protein, possible porin precursor [Rhodopseudomonas palustris]|uniref:porin n=2 Tax=Rhodopseudomonas palustris TaxID=1076 RepID=UPI000D1B0BFA|nr:porin [Rhodopseudomonas palustris]AVT77522.1 putative outer membrane protein, possible porin precursor [Rhodopseudomonas palustris]
MNFAKSLMLGGAALLVATAGAQAADLPLKAKAVEYVKVCSLYGAGFYYIPGTDTCIKLGGYVRGEVAVNASGMTGTPAWNGAAGYNTRLQNDAIFRSRADLNIDTRTATEYGVVRTYFDSVFTWTSGSDTTANGSVGVYFAFIQFAGFTFGKAVSQFDTPWSGSPGNITSNLIGGYDDSTGINQVAYTAQFGNGVTASVSLEDPSSYNQGGLYNVSAIAAQTFNASATPTLGVNNSAVAYMGGVPGVNSYGGVQIPDIVGQVRVDQAWGLFQVSAAAHQIRASYYTSSSTGSASETLGHPDDKWGYAVQAALSLKNLPTGAGDSLNLSATYADGASRYVIGGTSPNNFAMYGSSGLAYQSVALGFSGDGVFGNSTDIQKSSVWGVRGAFNHNWNPNWSTSVFGSYTNFSWSGGAKDLICGRVPGVTLAANVTYTGVCDPSFNIAQIGTVTRWTPVKNLTFSGEVIYTFLDQKSTGTITPGAVSNAKPAVAYELKDQGTWTGAFRVQRTF